MIKSLIYFSALFILSVSSNFVFAGYEVVGTIQAVDCYDFGISYCSTKTVTEVRKDGQIYELKKYYEKVSEYNSSKGTCHIKTKSKDGGLLSWGINAVTQPDFYGYDSDGKFGKIDADYIYFKCVKR